MSENKKTQQEVIAELEEKMKKLSKENLEKFIEFIEQLLSEQEHDKTKSDKFLAKDCNKKECRHE